MGNLQGKNEMPKELQEGILNFDCSARKIIDNLSNGQYENIVVMAGAGISVSCGIPDFRTPGTGLYDNLQRFNLPTPESVFELEYFKQTKGMAFYKLAKEMWPDNFKPSPAHLFVRLLHEKGLLLRCFTQNIDTLERAAGIPNEKIVEAHGSFASATCVKCKKPFDQDTCKNQILKGNIPVRCNQAGCGGLVKPDIVFFGEGLPAQFQLCSSSDLPQADLLIIMGTSLTVHPFASLVEMVAPNCPRLLLNMKPVGLRVPDPSSDGLRLRQAENYRDAMIEGTCDDAVRAICDVLGWRDELENLVETIQCKVGVHREPIDPNAAFPDMAPDGLSYNWRFGAGSQAPLVLPEPKQLHFRTEDVDIKEIEAIATEDEDGLALVALEELSKLRKGGRLAALLCLSGKSNEDWEVFHSLAIVPHTATKLEIDTIKNSEALMEPMRKEDAPDEDVTFHQVALEIPDEDEYEQFFVWYVNTTKGKVTYRWGPFEAQPGDGASEDESDEDIDPELEAELEKDLEDIIASMGDMPAKLEEN